MLCTSESSRNAWDIYQLSTIEAAKQYTVQGCSIGKGPFAGCRETGPYYLNHCSASHKMTTQNQLTAAYTALRAAAKQPWPKRGAGNSFA